MRSIKFDTVAGDTDIIFAIRYFVNPASNQFLIFFAFLDSFNFFDCAECGGATKSGGGLGCRC